MEKEILSKQVAAVLNIVKNKCYITDNTEETTSKVTQIIEDAIITIQNQIGINEEFDFSKPSEERSLFLNYCYYVWNDSTEEFYKNYLNDILKIRHKYEVKQNAEAKEN